MKWWRKWTGQELRDRVKVAEDLNATGIYRLQTATEGVLERTKMQRMKRDTDAPPG